ncbi:MAG: DUF349 domain-containing protein [Nocardioidaceae bacterium]
MSQSPDFGRVDADGTVYVVTRSGERAVGQWPGADPTAALDFYRRRYAGLAVEVELLEKRLESGALTPEEASARVATVRSTVGEAQAVGDLDALLARLDALQPQIDQRRQARRVEKAAKVEEARAAKLQIVEEAERLAGGSDWRGGANRLRELLDGWKALPRLDKPSDEALWHRFSTARTAYTRRRKQHFAELNERRDTARLAKEKLVVEAEELSTSTEWTSTARAYRDLMTRWKAAGGAHKDVDDALWKRFRAAQDTFFAAREAANHKTDEEYAGNAEAKRGLLVEAERLLPVRDAKTALESFRAIADRWDAAGKVPRQDMADLEGRFKQVEQTLRGTDEDRWRRSSPEARARAADTVAQLEATIASLEVDLAKAEAMGNQKAADEARSGIEARRAWLVEARKALTDFS